MVLSALFRTISLAVILHNGCGTGLTSIWLQKRTLFAGCSKRLRYKAPEVPRSETYSLVRRNDEGRGQRRRWAFFSNLLRGGGFETQSEGLLESFRIFLNSIPFLQAPEKNPSFIAHVQSVKKVFCRQNSPFEKVLASGGSNRNEVAPAPVAKLPLFLSFLQESS